MLGIINRMKKSELSFKILVYCAILFLAVTSRFIPHPANFTPFGALAIFAGFLFPRSTFAFFLPVTALLISDIFLGFYPGMAFVYVSFALVFMMSSGLSIFSKPKALLISSLGSSVIFYFVTNFGHWLSTDMYPKTANGLVLSYLAGLPFLKWTFLGDVLFVSSFWAIYSLAHRYRHFASSLQA